MTITIYNGNSKHVLAEFDENSIDAFVTDPPYGLSKEPDIEEVLTKWANGEEYESTSGGFMGKTWDSFVPNPNLWREAYRTLRPGGYLLAFAGTRTQGLMATSIEMAGFRICDQISYIYGSGFPKSMDVGKSLDAAEKKMWLDVRKALDSVDYSAILETWKEHSKTASGAGVSFAKSEIATGTNTPKSGSVPASVLLQANPENSDAGAVVAELSLTESRLTCEANCNSAQSLAESSTTELKNPATSAASPPASLVATLYMPDSFAPQSAWGWRGGSTADKLKAVEALKTWLGGKPPSRQEATAALCAALTDDLKLIMSSQSRTFRSFDTIRQTACVSAISATITEYTAESLISFTVDTLKSKAIDKAAGAEREVVGVRQLTGYGKSNVVSGQQQRFTTEFPLTSDNPTTEAAKKWDGWGTALKPAHEPVIVACKPYEDGSLPTAHTNWLPFHYVAKAAKKERNRGCEGLFWYKPNTKEGNKGPWIQCTAEAWKAMEGENKAGEKPWVLSQGNNHPTVKPVAIMKWLVDLLPEDARVVCDPFMGSGSTGLACKASGRDFIGIEMDENSVIIAKARMTS